MKFDIDTKNDVFTFLFWVSILNFGAGYMYITPIIAGFQSPWCDMWLISWPLLGRWSGPQAYQVIQAVTFLSFFWRSRSTTFERVTNTIPKRSQRISGWCIYLDLALTHLIRCFRKQWYPQIIHFNRVFRYQPSTLGYPYFWEHPILPQCR